MHSAIYFIDPVYGDDNGPGTQDAPMATAGGAHRDAMAREIAEIELVFKCDCGKRVKL